MNYAHYREPMNEGRAYAARAGDDVFFPLRLFCGGTSFATALAR